MDSSAPASKATRASKNSASIIKFPSRWHGPAQPAAQQRDGAWTVPGCYSDPFWVLNRRQAAAFMATICQYASALSCVGYVKMSRYQRLTSSSK